MRSARGASFIEAAIALPIILIAIFVVIDACRYAFGLAMFQLGAHRGAEVASKLESLTSATFRQQGIEQVRNEVLRFASLSGVRMIEINGNTSPFLTLPPPGEQGMIRIEVIGTFNSLIPFIGQDLFIRAQSITSTLDTANNLEPMEMCLDRGTSRPECACTFNQSELCDCPVGRVRLPDGSCQCVNRCNRYVSGTDCLCDCSNVTCTGNFVPDPENGCACRCPSDFECSTGPQNRWFRNMQTCTCDCDVQALNAYCIRQNKNPNRNTCTCDSGDRCTNRMTDAQCKIELNSPCAWYDLWACACVTCPRPGLPRTCNPTTGRCQCPEPPGACMEERWNCDHQCVGQNLIKDEGQCRCRNQGVRCDDGQTEPPAYPVMVGCNCECRCPDGYQLISNRCVSIDE